MVAKVYTAGWEAVCEECPDCSGLFSNNERHLAQTWAKEHNKAKHSKKETK